MTGQIGKFELRQMRPQEAVLVAELEQLCFPPNEACARDDMLVRAQTAPELFLVAMDIRTGELAGYLNGLATNAAVFTDDFFTDASLHDPQGENIMLLGFAVRERYRGLGLASEIMRRYVRRQQEMGRKRLILTCLEEKVPMYLHMGYADRGVCASTWGGMSWHEMYYLLTSGRSF